jgi:drug/metabolite transporter (DMT)-like permease
LLWIVATIIAAAAQTARNAMQSSLTTTLGTLGATQVRFVFGFPFAVAFLVGVTIVAQAPVPGPTARFLAFTLGAAVAQILGTAALLAAIRARSFSVATAFNKTEPVQVALFGWAVLGDRVAVGGALGIAIATAGVVLVAIKPGERLGALHLRPTVLGIASGSFFAIATVGFRGGILALGDGAYYLRAATTLVWSLGVQATLLGTWMMIFARPALARSFGLWRQSLFAGFMGAFASQFWFLGISLTAAANVRTLGLVEVLFAQAISRRVFAQRSSLREMTGISMVIAGVVLLLISA